MGVNYDFKNDFCALLRFAILVSLHLATFFVRNSNNQQIGRFTDKNHQIIVLTKQEGGFPGGETSIGSEFLLENDELGFFDELGLYPSCRILSSYLHGPVREDRLKITVLKRLLYHHRGSKSDLKIARLGDLEPWVQEGLSWTSK